MRRLTTLLTWLLAVPVGLGGAGCASNPPPPPEPPAVTAAKQAPLDPLEVAPEEFLKAAPGTHVVVDLDRNRLRVMHGIRQLWEAPVGTGTGLRLKGPDGEWHFTTPRGVFQIQYKEEVPIWVLPDWYYIERDLPIPPLDSPDRQIRGALGIAAVYIGQEIAIHGTDRPELLGQRVSHGCIRLANDYALRLFHNVQIGTPVVIIGGDRIEDEPPAAGAAPADKKDPPPDPLAGVPTAEILERLEDALARGDTSTTWVRLASRLMTRGLKDDAIALRGLLALAGTAGSGTLNIEYGHFLADAFSRGGLRAVVSLARIDEDARDRAARAIVASTMALYPGDPADPRAPWPTGRIPPGQLGPDGTLGWEALAEAENAYRATYLAGRSASTE